MIALIALLVAWYAPSGSRTRKISLWIAAGDAVLMTILIGIKLVGGAL